MCSIAERAALSGLAATEVDCLRRFRLEDERLESRALVTAVAEWLVLGQAAGTPCVALPFFDFDGIRAALGDDWFRRGVSWV